jgi:hypothetical protein
MNKTNTEKLLHELLEEAQHLPTRAERIELLKKYDGFALRTILQLAHNPKIELDFPEGAPPYKKSETPIGLQQARLKNIIGGLGSCVKGNNVSAVKKEQILIRLLESVDAKDAEIIIAAKDKVLHKLYSKVTENLVEKTFPALLK